jgi:selenocysteine lyase/cysteine desulfurase
LWPELRIADLFPDARGYLDSATIGLPPANAVTAMLDAIDDWRSGRAFAPGYDHHVARARSAFARIVGVPDEDVATGSQTSAFAGVVAASLAQGAEVLCARGDFTSVLFPFLVQRDRGVTVRSVALESIADEVRDSTEVVALSAVQSSDGRIADLDAVAQAARLHNSATFIDVTQACGWFPLDASQYDYVVCSAYKWLLSPRGQRLLRRAARAPERTDPAYRRVVRRRVPLGFDLRRAAAPGPRRAPARPLTRLVVLGGHGSGARAACRHGPRGRRRAQRRSGRAPA